MIYHHGGRMDDIYQIITDPAALIQLQTEWDALWRRADEAVFETFSWHHISYLTMTNASRLYCLLVRRNGALGLVWPFIVTWQRLCRVASPLGAHNGYYSSVLIEDTPDRQQRLAAAWNFTRRHIRCDLFYFKDVPTGSSLHAMLIARGAKVSGSGVAPYIVRNGMTWEAYYDGCMHKTHRRGTARKQRRLAEMGRLTYETVRDPAQAEHLAHWALDHKKSWLRHMNLDTRVLAAEYRRFLAAATHALCQQARCVIFVLRLEGRLIAVEICFVDQHRLEEFFGAFDATFDKYSPGSINKEQMIRWAFDNHLDVDLMIGDGRNKRFVCNEVRTTDSFQAANTSWGHLYLSGKAAMRRLNFSRVRVYGEDEGERYAHD
jgi:CelD/BcsL family acetyltransferase involved in cellulose biosynthesis